jgi:hypothetical protein
VNVAEVLVDTFGRVRDEVRSVVDGLSPDALAERLDPGANSIAWLVWHLTRVQDDHVAEVAGIGQVWTTAGWADRFGLPLDTTDTGYAHTPDQVASVQASLELLVGYHEAVHEMTVGYLSGLADADFDRVVDDGWDPPVTLGVRLVSVISDGLQHAGQAAYVRGALDRR